MMPARCYRTLPLLGAQPVRPFHPYQPSDWGALQRYARASLVPWQVPWQVTGRYVQVNPTVTADTSRKTILTDVLARRTA